MRTRQADLNLSALSYVKNGHSTHRQADARALQKNGPDFRGQFPFLACRLILVATALLARNHAAIVPLDGRGHHAAVLPRSDPHAAWAYADGGV